jgi:hypothetical protein
MRFHRTMLPNKSPVHNRIHLGATSMTSAFISHDHLATLHGRRQTRKFLITEKLYEYMSVCYFCRT